MVTMWFESENFPACLREKNRKSNPPIPQKFRMATIDEAERFAVSLATAYGGNCKARFLDLENVQFTLVMRGAA